MRKSLLSCALMLMISVAMLVGTTYAWFTEELVVEDNVIVLGTFDMEVQFGDPKELVDGNQVWFDLEGTKLYDTKHTYDYEVLQPGLEVKRVVKIENKGEIDLAVKVSFITSGVKLSYSLKYEGTELVGTNKYIKVPAGEFAIVDVTVTVPTHLGNENINLTEFFDFRVLAEQLVRITDSNRILYKSAVK